MWFYFHLNVITFPENSISLKSYAHTEELFGISTVLYFTSMHKFDIFPNFSVYQFKSVVLSLYKPPNTYAFLQACFKRKLVQY